MVMEGLGWTFDTVAETYEKLRPGYVKALYDKVFQYSGLSESSRAVEVGIGGGQATLPVLQTGCEVTAVEPGTQFSALCREKFGAYPHFSVMVGKFEEVPMEESAYDLIYSASAFHWVPEALGYPKVWAMLKSGGAFARFANHPFRGEDNAALTEALDRLYADYYYPFYNREPQKITPYSEAEAAERAEIASAYGFTDIQYALFYRTRVFSGREYRLLLGTYSDHIAMDEPVREEFFTKVEEAIDRYGGQITVYDTMDLQLARKP